MKGLRQEVFTPSNNSSSSAPTCKKKAKEDSERKGNRARDNTEGGATDSKTNSIAVSAAAMRKTQQGKGTQEEDNKEATSNIQEQ